MAVKPPPGLAARSAALNKKYGLVTPPVITPTKIAGAVSGAVAKTVDPFGTVPGVPPPSAPAPSGPGTISIPGQDPDWEALIKGDPNVISGLADIDRYAGQLSDAKRTAIQKAIIAAGLTDGLTPGGDIDQATLDAARANQFSTAHQLADQRLHQQSDLEAALAARGVLSSGALTGGSQRVETGYEQAKSDALNQLLSLISGYTSDFNAKTDQLAQRRSQLYSDTASRLQQDPRYASTPSDATLDPATGLYRTADGRWYDVNGNRVDAPGGNAAVPPPAAAGSPVDQAAQTSNQEWLARQAAQAAQGYHTAGF